MRRGRRLGGADPAAGELQVAQQRVDVGAVLGRPAAGGDGEAHRLHGAGQVAVELADVGDARERGEVGLEVDHALQDALGLR